MSSKFAFAVYDTAGLKRDLIPNNFSILKAGEVDGTLDVVNNNDGTYYFIVQETNKYSIKVNGITQDELSDIYIVTDDIITQALIDTDTLTFDGGSLAVRSGVFSLIDHNHDDDYSEIDHVHLTGGTLEDGGEDKDFFFDANNDNALTLSERSALSDDILSLELSLAQNIANLSAAVINLQAQVGETGILNYRQVGGYFNYADTAPRDTWADNKIADTWTETSTSYVQKLSIPFYKRPGDSEVTVLLSGGMSAGTGYVQMKTGADLNLTTENTISNTGDEGTTLTIDVSQETNRSHEIQILMRSGNVANTLTLQLITVEVR